MSRVTLAGMNNPAAPMSVGEWLVAAFLLLAAYLLTGPLGAALVAVAAAVFIAARFLAR